MTREDVLKLFPDATDEQITNLLNRTQSELLRAKNQIEKYKEDANKTSELQKELDELKKQGMSELEKANMELEKAKAEIQNQNQKIELMEQKNNLAKIGIIGEQADSLFVGGKLNYDVLGQIISERENISASNKEKELAGQAGNPNSGVEVSKSDKTEADKVVDSIISNISNSTKTTTDIINSYI